MDGYSVQEAASVLGVAEGRVWELLARGVLLGTPEGDSMRVFLKAEPGPIATSGPRSEPPRTNGNGGSHGDGEQSAFRELLTEFRNLTERYGQALLALGEARGEVAGLRSRVDQLEARLDLRLPPPIEAPAWESTTIPASSPEFAPESASPPRAKPRAPVRRPPRSRKAPSARETVAGFADALARAQDPNAAELGEAPEHPEALEATAEPATIEPAVDTLDQEMPIAVEPETEAEPLQALEVEAVAPDLEVAAEEPIALAETGEPAPPVADEAPAPSVLDDAEPPTYSAVVVEPDWFADGDFAWLDAADREAAAPAEQPPAEQPPAEQPPAEQPGPIEPPTATAEATPSMELPPLPDATVFDEPVADEPIALAEPASSSAPAAEPAVEPAEPLPDAEPVPVFEVEAEFEPWRPPAPPASVEPEPAVADRSDVGGGVRDTDLPDTPGPDAPEPQTMSASVAVQDLEEEVMWLGADPEPVARVEPRPQQRAEAAPWPAVDAAPPVERTRPPLAMTEDELARLALDEGWDENEVAAIRAMITPIPSGPVDLPGAAELHEAMAALEAVPVRSDPAWNVSRQWAKPAPEDPAPTSQDDWAFEAEPAPPPAAPRPSSDVTSALRRAADPNRLRRRQGPAAAAYRRLRRLFPG